MAKKLHLPDLMYGGLDAVADLVDEAGSEISMQELSCAVVNIARAVATQLRTIDKLAQRLDAIDGHIKSLLAIDVQAHEAHKSGSKVVGALEDVLVTRTANLQERVDELERRLERELNARQAGPR